MRLPCLSKWLPKNLIKYSDNAKESEEKTEVMDNIISPDFPVLPSEIIDVKKAVSFTDSFETWLKVTKLFISLIKENSDKIQNYFEANDFQNFTIQVHSLKSSARIIGAESLSQKAAELEQLGLQLQKTDTVSEKELLDLKTKTQILLNDYRRLDDILLPVKSYNEISEADKHYASDEEINKIKSKILQACSDFDLVTLEEEFNLLKTLKLPDSLNEKLPALSKAIEKIEYEQIEELLK